LVCLLVLIGFSMVVRWSIGEQLEDKSVFAKVNFNLLPISSGRGILWSGHLKWILFSSIDSKTIYPSSMAAIVTSMLLSVFESIRSAVRIFYFVMSIAKIGAMINAMVLMTLIRELIAGPAVSLKGSPIVSPTTAAL